nr:hypothetical protein [Bacteroidota bacterium]
MKNLFTLSLLLITISVSIFCQPPQAFKYQAVIRDNAGDILQNQAVGLRIGIRDSGGNIFYQETFSETTNQFGLVNLKIGNGTPSIGTFTGIDWSGDPKSLEIEIDPAGGTVYTSMGISELLSVPYALYSATSGDTCIWKINADTVYYDEGYVGIGTSSPGAKLDVAGHIWQTGTGKSVFVGEGAGANDDLINNKNVFIGYNAGNTNTTGIHNTASGYNSLFNNTSGGRNTATGAYSLEQNTTGDYNVAIGTFTLQKNTEGNYNTANGNSALTNNTTGNSNTASGCQSGYSNTIGYSNSFLGHNSGYSNTEGYSNAFIGNESGFSNTSGYVNSFFGFQSGYNNTEGAGNTFIGNKNGFQNTTGGLNTFIGDRSGYKITEGNRNTYLGYKSGHENTTGTGNVCLGYKAGFYNTYSDRLYIHNESSASPLIYGEFDNSIVGINGLLGVGTNSPANNLVVKSSGNSFGMSVLADDDDRIFRVGQMVEGGGGIYAYDGSDNATILFNGEGNSWIMSGRLGLGTIFPNSRFEVQAEGSEMAIKASSESAIAIKGISDLGTGVSGSGEYCGIYGFSDKYGVYGNGPDWAGYFNGDVYVAGGFFGGKASSVIDHPLDPENKVLCNNFVESPENLLIYRGKTQLDNNGEALVEMPDYFIAFTKEDEASIQLTPVGKPQSDIRYEFSYEWLADFNSFNIYGEPGRQISWMVLADRDDPVIHELGRSIEEEKGPDNKLCKKGKLLYPEAYGYPESMGSNYEMEQKILKDQNK